MRHFFFLLLKYALKVNMDNMIKLIVFGDRFKDTQDTQHT